MTPKEREQMVERMTEYERGYFAALFGARREGDSSRRWRNGWDAASRRRWEREGVAETDTEGAAK